MTSEQPLSADVPADRYTHGHHASVVSRHALRTAEREAAYLLPRLHPGLRLLDVGCGPGTISSGLARAVAPGEVVGIDVSADVIDRARAHVAEAGATNARFETANVYDLPYEAGSFDVAHAHQVMQHLADPEAALAEMRRVLRPGGLVAVRDADYATMSAWPRAASIDRWLEVYHAVAARNGADPDAGRRLRSWVSAAGFVDLEVTAVVELLADPADAADWGRSWAERALYSNFRPQAIEYGVATAEEIEAIARGWREWAESPEAFFMFVHVQCIGRAP
ncbi:MAG: methyltransferase domain-containing protein [Chloroflexi bacterium]|nr:methyltransferase domain-containing protein [Chloroflexota bacterium]